MAHGRGLEILVVDDTPTIRKILRFQLTKMGFHHIYEAGDGEKALKILHDRRIDLIISDWNMPRMTGVELLEAVRKDETLKATPFIMISAESSPSRISMAMKLKVDQYIIKPFTLDILEQKINLVIH